MLVIEELHFSFPGRAILAGLTLRLPSGQITCLLGGNGAGKTTLFNLIGGFLRPDLGKISLGSEQLVGLPPFQISRLGIGRTFQDLRLVGKLPVLENVLLALPQNPTDRLQHALLPKRDNRRREAADHQKAITLLTDFFLGEVAGHLASEISYGQQKLLTLACSVASGADILLLDEPVAGISPEFRERIVERLASLREAGKTILLIEHQADFLEGVGDEFLFLDGGRVRRFGSLTELNATVGANAGLN